MLHYMIGYHEVKALILCSNPGEVQLDNTRASWKLVGLDI